MTDDLEPLSAESYALADFSRDDWMDRPTYRDYRGVDMQHLKRLHGGADLHVCEEHIAFVSADDLQCFEIWLYDIVTWDHAGEVSSAQPSFRVLGRTWEGVTEVQACPAGSPLPHVIISQMQWVEALLLVRGWYEE